MAQVRRSFLLPMLVVAVAMPAAAALSFYKFTGDPSLRPLGVTKNSLDAGAAPQAMLEILVRVDWGRDLAGSLQQDDVRQLLGKALSIYDIDFRIQFRKVSGRDVGVTYLIGRNAIGPYRLHNASQGIPAALSAFQAMRPPQDQE
jgi:hypothetical protein